MVAVFPYHPVQSPTYRRIEFTKPQRQWILRRDGNECQFPFEHECHGVLHVHHILAQLYGREHLGLSIEQVNTPENAITLCQAIHVGLLTVRPDARMLHPDHRTALWKYQTEHDKDAFHNVSQTHWEMTLQGKKYWFFENDDILRAVAVSNTRLFEKKDSRYPERGR